MIRGCPLVSNQLPQICGGPVSGGRLKAVASPDALTVGPATLPPHRPCYWKQGDQGVSSIGQDGTREDFYTEHTRSQKDGWIGLVLTKSSKDNWVEKKPSIPYSCKYNRHQQEREVVFQRQPTIFQGQSK